MKNKLQNKRGFALITVMLIVALISMITSGLIYKQFVQIKRSGFLLHQSQGFVVMLGLERWTKGGLKLDLTYSKIDSLEEEWAKPITSVFFSGGSISGKLVDLNRRLNLNNLTEPDKEKRKKWHDIFQRYFKQQWKKPQLADLVEDWVDANQEPLNSGAEDDVYLIKQPPYRAANTSMGSETELSLVDGVELNELRKNRDDLTALPKITKINVNTATEHVLSSLASFMDNNLVKTWVSQRATTPVDTTSDFRNFINRNTGLSSEIVNKALSDDIIGVNSDFFQLNANVEYGEVEQHISGVFYRKDKENVYLIRRWQTKNTQLKSEQEQEQEQEKEQEQGTEQ